MDSKIPLALPASSSVPPLALAKDVQVAPATPPRRGEAPVLPALASAPSAGSARELEEVTRVAAESKFAVVGDLGGLTVNSFGIDGEMLVMIGGVNVLAQAVCIDGGALVFTVGDAKEAAGERAALEKRFGKPVACSGRRDELCFRVLDRFPPGFYQLLDKGKNTPLMLDLARETLEGLHGRRVVHPRSGGRRAKRKAPTPTPVTAAIRGPLPAMPALLPTPPLARSAAKARKTADPVRLKPGDFAGLAQHARLQLVDTLGVPHRATFARCTGTDTPHVVRIAMQHDLDPEVVAATQVNRDDRHSLYDIDVRKVVVYLVR